MHSAYSGKHWLTLALATLLLGLGACQPAPDKDFLISRIRRTSKLATVEYTLEKIIIGNKTRRLVGIKLTDAAFVAMAEIKVKAGIDLAKLRPEQVQVEGKKITLLLPPVEILNFSFPAEKIQLNEALTSQDGNGRLKMKANEVNQLLRMTELSVRRDLHFLDIEATTQEKTRKMLEPFLHQAGFKEVFLSFAPADSSRLIDLAGLLEEWTTPND